MEMKQISNQIFKLESNLDTFITLDDYFEKK